MRKTLIPFCAALLLFAGCSKTATVSYRVTIDQAGQEHKSELLLASTHVIDRRLESLGEKSVDEKTQTENDATILTYTLDDPAVIQVLNTQLLQPFTLRLMASAPPDKATVTVEGHGGFAETGFTEKDLAWVEAKEDPQVPGKGRVTLTFTDEGLTLIQKIFKEKQGEDIGLFVRGVLVSKMTVQGEAQQTITIDGIPSVEMARAFADDVNVGLHAQFEPLT